MRFLSSPAIRRCAARLSFAACATVAFVAAAQADEIHYVSTTGNNANDCTLAAPCRTLQRGIGVTPAGGEIRVLDSGFFGNSATIKKSLTISGNGHTVVLGSPITIDDAGARVALRALVLAADGSTTNGILITAAAAVYIEGCVVHGFPSFGIRQNLANAELFVTDSIVRLNRFSGLHVTEAGATAKVTVDNARFEDNGAHGLAVEGSIVAGVTRTVAAGNAKFGIYAIGARMTVTRTTAAHNGQAGYGVTSSQITLESSEAYGNRYGLLVSGTARISNSVFVNNTYGVRNSGGTVLTRGNNTVSGNTINVSGTLTPLGGI